MPDLKIVSGLVASSIIIILGIIILGAISESAPPIEPDNPYYGIQNDVSNTTITGIEMIQGSPIGIIAILTAIITLFGGFLILRDR